MNKIVGESAVHQQRQQIQISVHGYRVIWPTGILESITEDWYRLQLIRLMHAMIEKQLQFEQIHFNMIMLDRVPSKHSWEHWICKSYYIRWVHQTSLLRTSTCFHRRRMTYLDNTSIHMNKQIIIMGSFTEPSITITVDVAVQSDQGLKGCWST